MEGDKRTILVQVNGKKKAIKEVAPKAPSTKEANDEPMIPQPTNVIDFHKEREERMRLSGPFWDDGNRDQSPGLPFRRRKRSYEPYRKTRFPFVVWLALLCAILIGLTIGFILLSLFTSPSEKMIDQPEQAFESFSSFQTEQSILPPLQVEVVQGGAFSDYKAGDEMVQNFKEEGFAAQMVAPNAPYYMLIGVSLDEHDAEKISALYEDKGVETYVKSYDIAGGEIDGGAAVGSWCGKLIELYEQIVAYTAKKLTGQQSEDENLFPTLEKQMTALQTERASFEQLIDESMYTALFELENTLTQAIDDGKNERFMKAEQQLLLFLNQYEQLQFQ